MSEPSLPATERDFDIDILEAAAAVDDEYADWLADFLGNRVKEKGGQPKDEATDG